MTSMEYDLYEQHVRKLKDFCKFVHLNFRLECGSYPITLTLTPGEYYRQMSLLDTPQEQNRNASMLFALLDGEISVTASGGFSISDTSLKKILSLFAKFSTYWVEYIFQYFSMPDGGGKLREQMSEGIGVLWRNAKEALDVD